jgi:acetyl-CoA carboxylase carboxyl transferase subunit beta
LAWFKKEPLVSIKETRARMPEGLWIKCDSCKEIIYKQELERNLHVCPRCQHHFRIGARGRIELLVDPDSFEERHATVRSLDPLRFRDQKSYADRTKAAQKATGMEDALLSGMATIGGHRVSICALEFAFMGGSMGSVVGEKVTRAIEEAIAERVPVIAIACSGGARMQESALSLMQLVKTSAALARLGRARLPYIALLTDPTTGGVTASFAMLGDIAIAEPNALIGFAGPRVIQDTIRQELPPGFQRSEFLLNHGFLDIIVERRHLRPTLIQLLAFFAGTPAAAPAGP